MAIANLTGCLVAPLKRPAVALNVAFGTSMPLKENVVEVCSAFCDVLRREADCHFRKRASCGPSSSCRGTLELAGLALIKIWEGLGSVNSWIVIFIALP